MLAISVPENYDMSQSAEGLCYTELQPISGDLSYLIASSSDPCLPELSEEVCVEYVIHTEEVLCDPQDCSLYSFPDSPESLPEFVTEQDLLDTRLCVDTNICEESEDDDASVMLDLMDLSFLDDPLTSASEEEEGKGNTDQCVIEYLDLSPAQFVTISNDGASSYRQLTPSPSPPTPAHTPTRTSPPSPYSPPTTHTFNNTFSRAAASKTLTFRCSDNPSEATTVTAITINGPVDVLFPPSPPDSTTSASAETVSADSETLSEGREAMDFDTFDHSDGDQDEEADYKPYCDSKRGAKRNLLWKFLLWTLDHNSDVVRWTDVQKGVFKFVDTARVSSLWGQRKKKRDMTFEKLSRGIRHYYKRGLMERLSHTRLMYKFNWEKVPKRYRKA